MSQQFSNAPIYASYQPNEQQSASLSRPQSYSAPQQNVPTHHTLPPLTVGNNTASAFSNNTYPARTQPPPPSLMTTSHEQTGQSGFHAIYAPTANTFYNGQSVSFSQASHSQQMPQQSRPSPAAASSQQIYSSTPAPVRLPDLLPMPARGNGKLSLSLENHIDHLDAAEEPQPTHVVGSQGRRGILPSAAGRPAAVPGASTSGHKAAPTPNKDSEGKYPCVHCTKTYLHAKHLKRHLLRHTGVRPYTCGLCKDTFSRSDILKRHFQKCSVRRGNPSGESHLSHSRANKKSKQEEAARMDSNTPTGANQAQQMDAFTPTGLDGAFDINALTLGHSQYGESADQDSRTSSIKKAKRSTGSHSNRASLGMVNTSAYDPASYGYVSGHVTPDSATTSGAATPFTYMHESRSNQISPSGAYNALNGNDMGFGGVSRAPTSSNYNNGSLPHIAGQRGGHDVDWPPFSHYNSNDDYGNGQYHSGTNTPIHPIKSETDLSSIHMTDYPYLQSKA